MISPSALDRVGTTLALAILALLAASLALPVFDVNGPRDTEIGYLLFGWMGPPAGEWMWFANPVLLVQAWLLRRRPDARLRTLACAAVLAACLREETTRTTLLTDEGGIVHLIEAKLAGGHLWLGAMLVACAGGVWRCVRSARAAWHAARHGRCAVER